MVYYRITEARGIKQFDTYTKTHTTNESFAQQWRDNKNLQDALTDVKGHL